MQPLDYRSISALRTRLRARAPVLAVVVGIAAMVSGTVGARLAIGLAHARHGQRVLSLLPNARSLEWWYIEIPLLASGAVILMCALALIMNACAKRSFADAVVAAVVTVLLGGCWVLQFMVMMGMAFEYFP